jgi:gliding motility-associated-like protein
MKNTIKGLFLTLLMLILFPEINAQTQIFDYTGVVQTYTVPAGVTCIQVKMWGAGGGGGDNSNCGNGGGGAYVEGRLPVSPGETLNIIVGQGGAAGIQCCGGGGNNGSFIMASAFGGGGRGRSDDRGGGGGGGYSGIFRGTISAANSLAIAAGGGGGGGSGSNGGNGTRYCGGGGAEIGGTGGRGGDRDGCARGAGGCGGSPTAGGACLTGNASQNATNGIQLQGGDGEGGCGTSCDRHGGGGGGGGWFGGEGGLSSGGSTTSGGGGGGSSFFSGGLIGSNRGDGGNLLSSNGRPAAGNYLDSDNNQVYGGGGIRGANTNNNTGIAGQNGRIVITPVSSGITMGTFTLNTQENDIVACPGETVNIGHTGWNANGGTLWYWVGVENPAGSGWVTEWAIRNQECANLNACSFTVPALAPGTRLVVHSNANNGCWGPGVTRYVTITDQVPTMGTFTLNGQENDITACPGETVNIGHTGWNNHGGTIAYWAGVEDPAGSGWVTTWTLLENTCQNQTSCSFVVPALSLGTRIVVHSNGYNGCGWGTGVTRYVTIAETLPLFDQLGPYCSNDNVPALPSTSTNGITGSWSPAINNFATTTYTFTPDGGQCASSTNMTIVINRPSYITVTNDDPLCDPSQLSWVEWDNISSNTAIGNIDGEINIEVTHSAGGFFSTTEMFSGFLFPPQYNVPISSTSLASENAGLFTFCFDVPVNNPQIALSSVGNPGTPVRINTSVPYEIIWEGQDMTYLSNQSFIGAEGYAIIVFPGTHSCISFDYLDSEFYCNVAFGAQSTVCQVQPICLGESVTLVAHGSSNYSWSPSDGLNTTSGSTVIASPENTITYTVVDNNACQGSATITITVNPTDSTFATSTSCNPADVGEFVSDLTNQFGCDSVHTLTVTLLPSDDTSENLTSCDPADVGVFVSNHLNQFGCDSVHTLTVTLLPSDDTSENLTSCNPADVGVFVSNHLNQFGCDSTHTRTVTLSPSDDTSENLTSCNPGDVGVFVSNHLNQFGCDSTHTRTVTLSPSDDTSENLSSCNPADVGVFVSNHLNQFGCDSTHTRTVTLSPSDDTSENLTSCNPADVGVFVSNHLNQFGCDSTHTRTVTLSPSDDTSENQTSCNPADVGVFVSNHLNQFGCDSTHTRTVTLSPSDDTSENLTSCNPADVGMFVSNHLNQFGCDSVHTLTVTLLPSDDTSENLTSCNPADVGVFVSNHLNQFGCDSTHTRTVTLSPSDDTSENLTSCNPADVGMFVSNHLNQFGCDSVHTLTVTLLPSDDTSENLSSCNPADVGVFVSNHLNQFGCDSVHTLTVTLLPSDDTSENLTSCNPADVGVFVSNHLNQFGCDSTHTRTVTLSPSDDTSENLSSCNPADVGVFVSNHLNQFGCDSTHTRTVTLLSASFSVENIVACDSVQINSIWYFSSTSFDFTIPNGAASGCDSTVTYNVTINNSSSTSINEQICDGDVVTIGGQNFTATGVYQVTLTNAVGCDSVVNLNLNVIPATGTPPAGNTFNTGTNGSGGTLPGGSNDLLWQVSRGNINGPYNPAVVMSSLPGVYFNSPWPDAAWISHDASGFHSLDEEFYYLAEFDLACQDICGGNYTDPDVFCLNLEFFADNSVLEIYVNGVPQSSNIPGIPVADPYYHGGFLEGNEVNVSLCNNWQPGRNTIVVEVVSGPNFAGFLAQTSTNPPPVDSDTIDVTICQGDVFTFNGNDITTAGTYVETFSNQFGCDSVVTLNLSTNPTSNTSESASTCIPAQEGVVVLNLTNQFGCDSTHTITTTLLPVSNTSEDRTTCNPAEEGVVIENLVNQFGCDSVHTITTTLLPSSTSSEEVFSCDVNDVGTVILLLQNQFGCDSTHTIVTSLLPSDNSGETVTTCDISEVGSEVFVLTNQFGCDSVHTITTVLGPEVTPLFNPLNDVCQGDQVPELPEMSLNGIEGTWSNNLSSDNAGIFTSTFIPNSGQCATSATLEFTVSSAPVLFLDDITVARGNQVRIIPEISGSEPFVYNWSINNTLSCLSCANPVASPLTDQIYYLNVTDVNGCAAFDSMLVLVESYNIFIPDAFTPNNDGINDVHYVFGGPLETMKISIFNRWGEKVFESFDQSFGWDGTYKGELVNPDAFVYFFEGTLPDGERVTMKGSLTVIR